MKKFLKISTILILMINIVACSNDEKTEDKIYEKIHKLYYNITSYNANCEVTTYTKAGSNTYNCEINYDCSNDSYLVNSDNLKIILFEGKCTIINGENTIETPASKEDMYIFINTFFKSYYECEDTVVSVNSKQKSDFVILECSTINPSRYAKSMKLWINNSTVMPYRLQIMDSDGAVNTEVKFNDFDFTN